MASSTLAPPPVRRPPARRQTNRPPTPRRLTIIVALVGSLMLTLFARVYYVQLLDPHKPVQTAQATHTGTVPIAAPRGQIVDAQGRSLVTDTTVQTITVDRDLLQKRPDKGKAVLRQLATLLHTNAALLAKKITPCAPKVPAPCSTAEPFAPVTVATKVPTKTILAISEHREQFPGVAVQTVTQPSYPGGSLAAQVLGYTSDVTSTDVKANKNLNDADTIGASGLEQQYDTALRGTDGQQNVLLNPQGYTVGFGSTVAPTQGDTLVTSIDARVQALAESSLAQQIKDSRKQGKPATSGSVVIMDPNTGRIVAAASYPTYNPSVFIGGISNTDYAHLTSTKANVPLLNRATAGEYAPGSTFKLITSSSLVMHHEITTDGIYNCPGSLTIDGRTKTNYDSEVLGPISLRDALGYSCDTFFYRPAADEYFADQSRIAKGKKPNEYLQRMAAAYGVGTAPGVDLPAGEQSTGSYADRETRLARWQANKSTYCAEAKSGYKNVANLSDRAYLTQLASENCTDGWRYRAGDNADMSIGQGETTMSPLQLAIAYSAMFNGGKIYEPTFGWAVVNGKGKVVKTIEPKVRTTVPVKQSLYNYIANSLSFSRGWAVSGAFAYLKSPYRDKLGGKTGTAEVFGHQDTSWLASWGPTYKDSKGNVKAHLVMVGMIEQGGTGAFAAGPMEKRIWDGLFGVGGKKPLLPGQQAAHQLPDVVKASTVTHK